MSTAGRIARRHSSRRSLLPIQVLGSLAVLLLAVSVSRAGFRVDFNDNDGGVISRTQSGYVSVTETGADNVPSDIGIVDISLTGLASATNADRDRGALDTSQPLSDLVRDLFYGQFNTGSNSAPSLDITLSGVDAGTYIFTGYFHDNSADQGMADVEISVDGGSNFSLGLNDVPYSTGTNPVAIGMGSFQFTANGVDDVVLSVIGSGGQFEPVRNHVINGFDIIDIAGETRLEVNTDTGAISLSSPLSPEVLGYSLSSAAGSLDQTGWSPIADSDSDWTVLSNPSSVTDLSEFESGGGPGEIIASGTPLELSSGGAFVNSPFSRDLVMEVALPVGVVIVPIDYVGSEAIVGDLNFDSNVNKADYAVFIAHHLGEFPGLLPVQSYQLGDMDGDLANNYTDLQLFRQAYDDFNGSGAFAAMLASVPEPAALLQLLVGALVLLTPLRYFQRIYRSPVLAPQSVAGGLIERRPGNRISGRVFATGFIAASVLIASTQSIQAASITWSETVVDTTDGDSSPGTGLGDAAVSTNGTLVEAATFGTATNVTVNGVPFGGIAFGSGGSPTNLAIPYAQDFPDNNDGTSTGGDVDELTSTWSRAGSGVDPVSATIIGLTIGQQYEVQFIASFAGLGRTTTFDDGNGNTIVQSTNNPHAFATGLFTADAPTQAVSFDISSGSQFLNGYQLRAIGPVLEPAKVVVNTDTGLVSIVAADSEIEMDYYIMSSDSGALDTSGWISLDDQNFDAVDGDDGGDFAGDSLLEGWDEAGESNSESLAEVFFLSSSSLASGEWLALGHVFTPGASTEDLSFQYNQPGGLLSSIAIETTSGYGDMNGDGVVDEEDVNPFVLALTNRAAYEAAYPGVNADIVGDINQDEAFDLGDVGPFKSLFSSGLAQSAAVPEPSTIVLLTLGAMAFVGRLRRRA